MNTSDGVRVEPSRSLRSELSRVLLLAAAPFATVCALLGLAVVVPEAGFLVLLLVVSVSGFVLAAPGGGSTVSFARIEGGHEASANAEPSSLAFQVPKEKFLVAYLYGLGGFGTLGLVVAVVLLF